MSPYKTGIFTAFLTTPLCSDITPVILWSDHSAGTATVESTTLISYETSIYLIMTSWRRKDVTLATYRPLSSSYRKSHHDHVSSYA